MRAMILGLAMVVAGCGSSRPTALQVCGELSKLEITSGCIRSTPSGFGAAARDRAEFSTEGRPGQVLTFASPADFDATVRAFDGMASLVGRHRYASRDSLVFVQLNAEVSDRHVVDVKNIVEGK